MSRVSILAAGAMALVMVPVVGAQEPEPPAVGSRVRIYAPAERPDTVVGDLLGYAAETLTLVRVEGDTLTVPYAAITCIEVRRMKRHPLLGAATGLLVGGAVGATAGSVGPGCGARDCKPTEERVVGGMAALGLAGGVVGTLSTTETWDAVPVSCLRVSR